MKRRSAFLAPFLILVLLLLLSVTPSHAAKIWTDGTGDGLPDSGNLPATVNSTVTITAWIDSESFTWTNYVVYIERSSGALILVSAAYLISGGANFPIDTFSNPRAVGFGGIFYDNIHGVNAIGTITGRPNRAGLFCYRPIIDPQHILETFSALGTQTSYTLFGTRYNTCYQVTQQLGEPKTHATESVSWGQLKGLYR
jgi:hypothetical protein